mgnify:CR=1 FL=1
MGHENKPNNKQKTQSNHHQNKGNSGGKGKNH